MANRNQYISDRDSELIHKLLKQMSLSQLAYYAVQNAASHSVKLTDKMTLPPTALGGIDAVGGVVTDFPLPLALGQTFDLELVKQIGTVIGLERLEKLNGDATNTLLYTAAGDVRVNPLSGRLYEGFSEDVYQTTKLATAMIHGVMGESGQRCRSQAAIKHFTAYQAEWNREDGTNYISCREFYERFLPPFEHAINDAGAVGVMTSYGATNEIPNAFSPFIKILQQRATHHLFNVSDFGADANALRVMGKFGNYAYVDSGVKVAALMILAGSFSNNIDPEKVSAQDYIDAVENHVYGVDRQALENHIRPLLELWMRSGYFDQKSQSAFVEIPDVNVENRQALAKRAARESIVLLKNTENILPLSVTQRLFVTGQFADLKLRPFYAAFESKTTKASQETLINRLKQLVKNQMIENDASQAEQIILRDRASQFYLTNIDEQVTWTANSKQALLFQVLDWGQDAHSLLDVKGQRYLSVDSEGKVILIPKTNHDTAPLFTMEYDTEKNLSMRCNAIVTQPYTTLQLESGVPYYRYSQYHGQYLQKKAMRFCATGEQGIDPNRLGNLEIITVEKTQINSESTVDVAAVVIGADPKINASEMQDRKNMDFGKQQLNLVEQVSKSYPKRTVVIIQSDFPMNVQGIQNNPNVSAILYVPYGGQAAAEALTDVLFGKYSPAGRLSMTWPKDITTLPQLNRPHGHSFVQNQTSADKGYCCDMKAISAEEFDLSYQYMPTSAIEYSFGFGLSYSSIRYSNLQLNRLSDVEMTLTGVLENQGQLTTDEVVQVYMQKTESGYQISHPVLVGFSREPKIMPREKRSFTLKLDLDALNVWDTVAGKYCIEPGTYRVSVNRSATDPIWTKVVNIEGTGLRPMSLMKSLNVWSAGSAQRGMQVAEISLKRTVESKNCHEIFAVESSYKDAWVRLWNVHSTGDRYIRMYAANRNSAPGKIELVTDPNHGEVLALITVKPSRIIETSLENDKSFEFQAYDIELNHPEKLSGTVYLKFESDGLLLDTIQTYS